MNAPLQLIFARNRTPGSLLLRVLGNSRWSHVGVIDGDAVIEARAFRRVAPVPLAEFKARYSAVEVLDVSVPDPEAGLAYARSRIGCHYAYRRLIALLLHIRMPHGDGTEYCADLAEDTVEHSGHIRVRPERRHRLTVEHVYMLA